MFDLLLLTDALSVRWAKLNFLSGAEDHGILLRAFVSISRDPPRETKEDFMQEMFVGIEKCLSKIPVIIKVPLQ
jgi:hypothetical protein